MVRNKSNIIFFRFKLLLCLHFIIIKVQIKITAQRCGILKSKSLNNNVFELYIFVTLMMKLCRFKIVVLRCKVFRTLIQKPLHLILRCSAPLYYIPSINYKYYRCAAPHIIILSFSAGPKYSNLIYITAKAHPL